MGNILNIINSDKHFYDSNDFGRENYMKCLDGAFFSSEIYRYLQPNLVDIDDIQENTNYVYLIECRNKNAIYSGILNVPQEILDLVNKDRCKVIFSYEAEGDLNVDYFNGWYNLTCQAREDTIKFSNFYIFHCELSCEKNNKTPINFFQSTHHFDSTSFNLNKIIEQNSARELDEFDYEFSAHTTKDINVEDKSKYFLSYLRNCGRDHRKVLAAYFQHNDLWDKNNLSFLKVCFANSNMGSITDYKLPKKYLKSFKELDSLPMIEIDTQNVKDKMGFNTSFSSNWKHYQETFLSVVSETIYEGKNNFFSEKICKPLVNLHPFIVMSTPYTLRKLQEFGFKTYHPFINENYDHEEDIAVRTKLIFEELDNFQKKSNEELKDWWRKILPILEHNQTRLLEFGKGKTKKIKLLENLYD